MVAADPAVAGMQVVVHGYEVGADSVDVVAVRRADLDAAPAALDEEEVWRGEHRLRRAGSRHGARVLLIGSSRRHGMNR
jgi:hypothetical protein